MKRIDRKFISIDPQKATLKEVHNVLLGGIAPRPIALVSTISEKGINNLAPFSFFNAFGANPPYVAFSPSNRGRDGTSKDTFNNLQKLKECVINSVSYDMVEQISLASTEYSPDVDEFIKSGFTALDSDLIKPKRVKESPLQMECHVEQIIPLGGTNGSGNLVLCRVIKFHVDEGLYIDDHIDPNRIDLVGRNSANYYTRASGTAVFEVFKPKIIGIGFDRLPEHILTSKILSANNLAQLAGIEKIPDQQEIKDFLNSFHTDKADSDTSDPIKHGNDFKEIFEAGLSLAESDKSASCDLIETAAKKALLKNEVEFAILALLSIKEI